MNYLCLVYLEETTVDALPGGECEALGSHVVDHREKLGGRGNDIGTSPLQSVRTATTIRFSNGAMSIIDGPFAETREPLGGFYLIEARDLNDAIRMVAKMSAACTGSIEVRAIKEMDPR